MPRRSLISIVFGLSVLALACSAQKPDHFKAGDVLFQDLNSPQSQAVKLATGSEFTHCGIVLEREGELVVYEAVQPVRVIPLKQWINQGVEGRVVCRRVKSSGLDPANLEKMRLVAESHLGKNYDLYFGWSDDRMYCSEYVWKIYDRGLGVELAAPRKLADYDLSHPAVQAKMAERYGDDVPLDEPVVAPSDLYQSTFLETVYDSKSGKEKQTGD